MNFGAKPKTSIAITSKVVTGMRNRSPGNARKKLVAPTQTPALSIRTAAGFAHIPKDAGSRMLDTNSAVLTAIRNSTKPVVLPGSRNVRSTTSDPIASAATMRRAPAWRIPEEPPSTRKSTTALAAARMSSASHPKATMPAICDRPPGTGGRTGVTAAQRSLNRARRTILATRKRMALRKYQPIHNRADLGGSLGQTEGQLAA